jgi:hypothetical protein
MAGYSGTPLVKKLGIKEGARVSLFDAPPDFGSRLEGLPKDVALSRGGARTADVIVLFAPDRAALRARFPAAARILDPVGGLCVAWP